MRKLNVIGLMLSFFILGLAACSSGSGNNGASLSSPVLPPNPNPTTVSVSGAITYDRVPLGASQGGLDYNSTTQLPARSVKVELLSSAGAVLATDVTDMTGNYAFSSITSSTDVQLRVPAQLVPETGTVYDISVVDNTSNFAPYALLGTVFNTGTANITRNLNASRGNDIDDTALRPAGPFAILDSIYSNVAAIIAVDSSAVFPALQVRWSVNNRPDSVGGQEGGGIGTSFYTRDSNNMPYLAILGREGSDTDEYDDHVIVHEFGHYFEDNFSRSDSQGGSHNDAEALDMRLAFGEGFATALSAMVLETNVYRDSSGTRQASGFGIDLEDNTYTPGGWFNEGSVGSIVFDVFDAADANGDAGDTIAAGFGPIYRAMISDAYKNTRYFTSIFSWAAAVAAQPEVSEADLLALVQRRGVNSVLASGVGETNDAGNSALLPVFNPLILSGPSAEICSINDFGTSNKAGVATYGNFTIPTGSSSIVQFNVAVASGDASASPRIGVYKEGAFMGTFALNVTNSTQNRVSLTAGEYAFELYVTENLTIPGTDVCYNISIQ